MFGGVFYTSCTNQGQTSMADGQGQVAPAFRVGDIAVPGAEIQDAIDNQLSTFGGAEQLPPRLVASQVATVLNASIDRALLARLAQTRGIQFSDEAILAAQTRQLDEAVQQARQQAILTGQLKADATPQQFDEFIKKQAGGRTLAQIREEQTKSLREALADPSRRSQVLLSVAPLLLQQSMRGQFNPSEAELRASYDQLTVKRILLKEGLPGKSAAERAQEALAAIQGGLSFEQAMDRYSNDLPQGSEKVSQNTTPLSGSTVLADPQLRPIADLKPGQVSGVLDTPEGKIIVKLISRKSELPKDFEKNKATYRSQLVDQYAGQAIEAELRKLRQDPNLVKWEAPGYRAIYEFGRASEGAVGTDSEAKMRQVYELATQAVQKNQGYDARAAALARFASLDTLYNAAAANREALRDERIASIQSLLETGEFTDLRLQLVDLYVQANRKDEAFNELLTAARNNTRFDPVGQERYRSIAAKLAELQRSNTLTAEQAKQVQGELERYRTEQAEDERQRAEQQKRDEAARREAEKNAPGTAGGATAGGGSLMPPGAAPTPGAPAPGAPAPGAAPK